MFEKTRKSAVEVYLWSSFCCANTCRILSECNFRILGLAPSESHFRVSTSAACANPASIPASIDTPILETCRASMSEVLALLYSKAKAGVVGCRYDIRSRINGVTRTDYKSGNLSLL